MSGFRTNPMAGFRIVMATGPTSPTTVGRGLATSLGGGRRITTVAGSPMAGRGPGGLVRFIAADFIVRSGRLRMYRSSVGVAALASESALAVGAALAGSQLDLATFSTPGGVAIGAGSA